MLTTLTVLILSVIVVIGTVLFMIWLTQRYGGDSTRKAFLLAISLVIATLIDLMVGLFSVSVSTNLFKELGLRGSLGNNQVVMGIIDFFGGETIISSSMAGLITAVFVWLTAHVFALFCWETGKSILNLWKLKANPPNQLIIREKSIAKLFWSIPGALITGIVLATILIPMEKNMSVIQIAMNSSQFNQGMGEGWLINTSIEKLNHIMNTSILGMVLNLFSKLYIYSLLFMGFMMVILLDKTHQGWVRLGRKAVNIYDPPPIGPTSETSRVGNTQEPADNGSFSHNRSDEKLSPAPEPIPDERSSPAPEPISDVMLSPASEPTPEENVTIYIQPPE